MLAHLAQQRVLRPWADQVREALGWAGQQAAGKQPSQGNRSRRILSLRRCCSSKSWGLRGPLSADFGGVEQSHRRTGSRQGSQGAADTRFGPSLAK